MKRLAKSICLLSLALLSGCISDEQYEAEQQVADRDRCSALGFAVGSTAMATCMNTAANKRQAEQAQEREEDRRWSEDDDRREAAKKAQSAQNAAIAAEGGGQRPTIERMGGNGEDANMALCSDGALREECSDAPNGF